ncbi:hypothetical protein LshimejAT787_1502140 [Lyophyllum shimeji]|uniref:Uncharacterized protein n=1 Tax=Lyophyllum shimeji TaxID=47721 RepID=A0A9P3PXV2_LYOSH|nr:hypothetical protein LshimejAT787_1502140 [Lyophyllum shimeji]
MVEDAGSDIPTVTGVRPTSQVPSVSGGEAPPAAASPCSFPSASVPGARESAPQLLTEAAQPEDRDHALPHEVDHVAETQYPPTSPVNHVRAPTPPPAPKVKMSLKDYKLRKQKRKEEDKAAASGGGGGRTLGIGGIAVGTSEASPVVTTVGLGAEESERERERESETKEGEERPVVEGRVNSVVPAASEGAVLQAAANIERPPFRENRVERMTLLKWRMRYTIRQQLFSLPSSFLDHYRQQAPEDSALAGKPQFETSPAPTGSPVEHRVFETRTSLTGAASSARRVHGHTGVQARIFWPRLREVVHDVRLQPKLNSSASASSRVSSFAVYFFQTPGILFGVTIAAPRWMKSGAASYGIQNTSAFAAASILIPYFAMKKFPPASGPLLRESVQASAKS